MADDKIIDTFGECQVAVESLPAAAVLTRTANSMGDGATIKYRRKFGGSGGKRKIARFGNHER